VAVWYRGTAFTGVYSEALSCSGTALLEFSVWQFSIAGPLYWSLEFGSLVQRVRFPGAYIMAVWYSGTALLEFTVWQFGIAGTFLLEFTLWQVGIAGPLYWSLQFGSLV
jgi:hypothetical protein